MINFLGFGQTPIDADEALDLIPDISDLEALNRWEHENIIDARRWALNTRVLKVNDVLDVYFVMKLHKKMFDKTWKWSGDFRKSCKNIGCEVYEIRSELKILQDDVIFWMANSSYSIKELALIFHHRLVKIHLFPNGNGRHARLMADCILKKFSPSEKINWEGNDFNSKEELRKTYIKSLQKADKGDYRDLFRIFL